MSKLSAPSPPADLWDGVLALALFGLVGALVWAAPGLLLDWWFDGWRSAWIGLAATGGASLAGAVSAPGLVGLARSGASLGRLARRGVRVTVISFAFAALLGCPMVWMEGSGWIVGPLTAGFLFVASLIVLSPLYLVGAGAAAAYGAIVRGAAWTAPSSLTYSPQP